MPFARIAPILLLAALSAGCLRMSFALNLKQDGSGTITQTIGMSKTAIASAGSAIAMALEVKDAKNAAGELGDIPFFKEDELKASAESTGMRFVSLKPLADPNFQGQTATFAFDDIRKLPLNLANMMFGGLAGKVGPKDLPADAGIGVSFTRDGGRSILVLTMPQMTGEEVKKRAEAQAERPNVAEKVPDVPPEMVKMMQDMMSGFSVELAINIEGTIVSTNAPFVEGSKVTLMKIDFGELMKSANDLQAAMATLEKATDNLEDLMKMPGLKLATQREIRIEFR